MFKKEKDNLTEWINHQYDPGHYTGGRQHYSLDKLGKPDKAGFFLIIMTTIQLVAILLIIFKVYDDRNIKELLIFFLLAVLISSLLYTVGFKLIKQKYTDVEYKIFIYNFKKKLIYGIITILSIWIINTTLLTNTKIIYISDANKINVELDYNQYYVNFYEINIRLKCNRQQKRIIYDAVYNNELLPLKIEYKYRIYNVEKGFISEVTDSQMIN